MKNIPPNVSRSWSRTSCSVRRVETDTWWAFFSQEWENWKPGEIRRAVNCYFFFWRECSWAFHKYAKQKHTGPTIWCIFASRPITLTMIGPTHHAVHLISWINNWSTRSFGPSIDVLMALARSDLIILTRHHCSIRNRCRNKRRNQVNPCCFDTFDSVSCYETMAIHIYFDAYHGLNPCVIIFCWQEQSSIYMLQIKLDCTTADCFKDVYFFPRMCGRVAHHCIKKEEWRCGLQQSEVPRLHVS